MTLVEFLLLLLALGALAAAIGLAERRADRKAQQRATPSAASDLISQAPPTPRWWQRTRTDVIVTAAFALLSASVVHNELVVFNPSGPLPMGLARIWAILVVAPLAIRRKYPVESAAAIAVFSAMQVLVGIPLLLPANISILIAVFSATVYGPKWAGTAALWIAFAGSALLGWRLFAWEGDFWTGLAFAFVGAVLAIAAWALGKMRRAQYVSVKYAHERAQALAELSEMLTQRNAALLQRNDALELERDQQAQIAAAAERARIAREMHDIIGHSIANIIVLANGARVAAAANPAVAVGAFEAISETGTEALATTKQLLGVLRAPDAQPQSRPAPGNIGSAKAEGDPIGIRALLNEVRNVGTVVEFNETGAPQKLSSAATNTFYRVCQEALTNARKYGAPNCPVQVQLDWQPDALTLIVENDLLPVENASAVTQQHPGYGLIGMRERAALISGDLTSGPIASGNKWLVRLTAPITG